MALLITGCTPTDVYYFKTNRRRAAQKPSPIISSFLNWAEEKLSMQPLWRRKVLLKQETQQTFVNGLLPVLLTSIYAHGSACVLTIIAWVCLSIWAQLYHCSLIYFWVPWLFLHSDPASLSEGEIIPFSGVCQSGEAALSTPEAVVASRTDWQTALMCNRRRPAATSSRQASFSAHHQLTLQRILHRAQQHHADASACQ